MFGEAIALPACNGLASAGIKVALAQANPWEALVQEFVELRKLESELCRAGRVERHVLQGKLIRLYSQYTAEWESFSARRLCDRGRRIA